jgi:hypothetical protein
MGSTNWYVQGHGGHPNGPFTTEQLISQIRMGTLRSTVKVNRGGTPEWLPAAQVQELRGAMAERRASLGATLSGPKHTESNRWMIQYGLILLIAVAVGFIGVALARTL